MATYKMTLNHGVLTACQDGTEYLDFYLPKDYEWTTILRSNGEMMLRGKSETVKKQAEALVDAGVCDMDEALKTVREDYPDFRTDYRGYKYPVGTSTKEENSGKASEQEHYKASVQPLQIMQMVMTQAEILGFLKGNVIKYACRAGKKAGESYEKDMTKCKQYYDWVKELEATGKITI